MKAMTKPFFIFKLIHLPSTTQIFSIIPRFRTNVLDTRTNILTEKTGDKSWVLLVQNVIHSKDKMKFKVLSSYLIDLGS